MFSKKLFSDDIEPKCKYCQNGEKSKDGRVVLCDKKGIVDEDFSCRKFNYDPIKRVPRKAPQIKKFNSEDFSL